MTSIEISLSSSTKMTARSIASACSLGFSSASIDAAVPGVSAVLLASGLGGLPVLDRNERPTKAPEAGVAAAKVRTYAFAATGAETKQQTQHHTMWAFRGLEPWRDPA